MQEATHLAMNDSLKTIEDLFTPSTESVAGLIEEFQNEIRRGLNEDNSSIAMHPS